MTKRYFIKYISSPYFIMTWLIWGGISFYQGKFDQSLTSEDITTYNVEYLRSTSSSGNTRVSRMFDLFLDKKNDSIIQATASGSHIFYRMSDSEKKDLTIKVIPPKGKQKWVRIIEIKSDKKIYYSLTLDEENERISLSIIDLCILLFLNLASFIHFYGRNHKMGSSLNT